jgi:response regulator NasT
LLQAVGEAGYRIVKFATPNDALTPYVREARVDAIIYYSDVIDHNQLREIRSVSTSCPTPVLMLTHDAKDESIAAAVKAGVSSYVVDCTNLSRISYLVRVARARFAMTREIQDELESVRSALQQRKIIEKAKGIIMKQRKLDEDNAYKTIRKLAMDHNKKIAEVAGQIVTAAEVLL